MTEEMHNLVIVGWKPVCFYLGAIMERFKQCDIVKLKFSNEPVLSNAEEYDKFIKTFHDVIEKSKKLTQNQKDFVEIFMQDMVSGARLSRRDKAMKIILDLAHLGVCCHQDIERTTETRKNREQTYITVTLYKYGTLKAILANVIETNKEALRKL